MTTTPHTATKLRLKEPHLWKRLMETPLVDNPLLTQTTPRLFKKMRGRGCLWRAPGEPWQTSAGLRQGIPASCATLTICDYMRSRALPCGANTLVQKNFCIIFGELLIQARFVGVSQVSQEFIYTLFDYLLATFRHSSVAPSGQRPSPLLWH